MTSRFSAAGPLAALAAALSLAPAAHGQAGTGKVLVIYGDDKCPTSGGEEIVVCARKPESERFRIPQELRNSGAGLPPSWSEKAKTIEYVGQSGIASCSPVGTGGATGCHRQLMRRAREERQAAAAAAR